MSNIIKLTWPETRKVKGAITTVEKIMQETKEGSVQLETGMIIEWDIGGVRIRLTEKE